MVNGDVLMLSVRIWTETCWTPGRASVFSVCGVWVTAGQCWPLTHTSASVDITLKIWPTGTCMLTAFITNRSRYSFWCEFDCGLSQSSGGPSDHVLHRVKEREISSVKCRNSGECENTSVSSYGAFLHWCLTYYYEFVMNCLRSWCDSKDLRIKVLSGNHLIMILTWEFWRSHRTLHCNFRNLDIVMI